MFCRLPRALDDTQIGFKPQSGDTGTTHPVARVAENRLLPARDPVFDLAVLARFIQVLIGWAVGVRRVVMEGR